MIASSYKFGEFELDCARYELRRNGQPLKLERIPMDLLILLIEKDGNDKAFAVIDDPSGPFVKGDMYVFVTGFDGTTLAHGTNKVLVGKNLIQVKDADGKLFVQEMIDVAKSKGEGWVDYKWPNPVTHKIEAKTTFLKRVGDELVGCGIYKG